VLLVHGDADQIVPFEDSSKLSAELIPDATLKVYPGAPHGLPNTTEWKDELNRDLLDFLRR
jgi:non-heme chloroperoxidase